MVHALEIIQRLLHPEGVLIDVHPTPEPAAIEVAREASSELAGWLSDEGGVEASAQAEGALAQAQVRGWFDLDGQQSFDFLTHADSLDELQEYLAEEWEAAEIDPQTCRRIEDLIESRPPGTGLILRETAVLSRFRRLGGAKPPSSLLAG